MIPAPRSETADLCRRIHDAARRNGTDPANLPRIYAQYQRIRAMQNMANSFTTLGLALIRATEQMAALSSPLSEFADIAADLEAAQRERR